MALTTPPIAAKKPASATHHGITVTDDYAWLRDPGYPEVTDKAVLAHLEAENAWFKARMAPQQGRIDALFKEMRARIKEADKSVPQKDGDWLYWIEFEEGAEYKKWWRRPVAGGARPADPRRGRAGRRALSTSGLARSRCRTTGGCSPGRSMTTARNASLRGSR